MTSPPPPTSPQSSMIWGGKHKKRGDAWSDFPSPHSPTSTPTPTWAEHLRAEVVRGLQPAGRRGRPQGQAGIVTVPGRICAPGFHAPRGSMTLNSKLKTSRQIERKRLQLKGKASYLSTSTAPFAAFRTFSFCNGLHKLSSQCWPSLL